MTRLGLGRKLQALGAYGNVVAVISADGLYSRLQRAPGRMFAPMRDKRLCLQVGERSGEAKGYSIQANSPFSGAPASLQRSAREPHIEAIPTCRLAYPDLLPIVESGEG